MLDPEALVDWANSPKLRTNIYHPSALHYIENIGVPYGSRTRAAAVKEKRPGVIQWNLAAWIALYRI